MNLLYRAPAIYGIMDASLVAATSKRQAAKLLSDFYNVAVIDTTLKRVPRCFYNGDATIIKMFEKEIPEKEMV
jgi:hypothetical protein